MPGCAPADVPAFEHGDAGAEAGGLQSDRQAGKACADEADVDIQIERKTRALARRPGVRSAGRACINLAHIVFLRADPALVTLSCASVCTLILRGLNRIEMRHAPF